MCSHAGQFILPLPVHHGDGHLIKLSLEVTLLEELSGHHLGYPFLDGPRFECCADVAGGHENPSEQLPALYQRPVDWSRPHQCFQLALLSVSKAIQDVVSGDIVMRID